MNRSFLSVNKSRRRNNNLNFYSSSGNLGRPTGDSQGCGNTQNAGVWQITVLQPNVQYIFFKGQYFRAAIIDKGHHNNKYGKN